MYNHPLLDPNGTPRTIQNKVQMDLHYYFVRRGSENIYKWTKSTFKVVKDPDTGITYIEKDEDEETKNHKETNEEIVAAFMPEIRGSRMCPVVSFTRVGQNTLDMYISNLCGKIKNGSENKNYTNHSLRVSGITNLTGNNFTNKQIMSISGHKNQESLAIYQKVNANEKLRMGLTLGYTLLNKPIQQEVIAPAQVQVQGLPIVPQIATASCPDNEATVPKKC